MILTDEQKQEIRQCRTLAPCSFRPRSAGMEDRLHLAVPVLDQGFVRAVDYMGNDEAIVQMARVSYGSGTKKGSSNRDLIRYLMRHHHTSPFEGCEIKLHVKLPIFVARQWIRHRTANVNEVSARYSVMPREFYIPELKDLARQSSTNKQGRGEPLSKKFAQEAQEQIEWASSGNYDIYELLTRDWDKEGYDLARETARMVLPTNLYTEWYWKTDLHNLFHFIKLRADPHAQFEIRCYAQAVAEIVKDWVPLAYEAFKDYRQNAVTFSAQEMAYLKEILSSMDQDELNEVHGQKAYGLSKREATEFIAKLRC